MEMRLVPFEQHKVASLASQFLTSFKADFTTGTKPQAAADAQDSVVTKSEIAPQVTPAPTMTPIFVSNDPPMDPH